MVGMPAWRWRATGRMIWIWQSPYDGPLDRKASSEELKSQHRAGNSLLALSSVAVQADWNAPGMAAALWFYQGVAQSFT